MAGSVINRKELVNLFDQRHNWWRFVQSVFYAGFRMPPERGDLAACASRPIAGVSKSHRGRWRGVGVEHVTCLGDYARHAADDGQVCVRIPVESGD